MSLLNPKPDIAPEDPWKREHDAWMRFQRAFPQLLSEIEKNAEALKSQFPSVHAAWADTMQQLKEMIHSQAEQDELKKKSTKRRT